ncbi:DHHA1 domain-containing protein, partial [Klebsiella pneumoniae]|nr:DHHA1 domain-containing protein [Klebsiella pneumoniae]
LKQEDRIIVIADESYHEGIIGLIAGKLAEYHYLPSIVISKMGEVSRGSARTIPGSNILEIVKENEDLLIGGGGHKAAAGFSIRTENIERFR